MRKAVLTELHIGWTTAQIKRQILEVFPEQPDLEMLVAKCESGLKANAKAH